MPELNVDFAGLKLKNPLIAAAGPITANIDNVKRLVDSGIAAIVTKTGFTKKEYEQWVGRKNIFPYKPVYKYQGLKNGRLLSLPTLLQLTIMFCLCEAATALPPRFGVAGMSDSE